MKLKPQDLRVGSIVMVNNPKYHPQLKGIPLLITGIHENSNGYVVNLEHINQEPNNYYDTYSQLIEYIEPIPLSEEWLAKCGLYPLSLSKNAYWGEYKNGWTDFEIRIDGEKYIVLVGDDSRTFGMAYKIATIKYVHQLQNLAFALNKGLEIR